MTAITAPRHLAPASVTPARADTRCQLVDWKPWPFENPSLLGHATVSFSGWVVNRTPVFRNRDGGLSVGSPSAPEIDAEGHIRINDVGKKQYWPLLTFETKEAKDRFERMGLGALAAAGIADPDRRRSGPMGSDRHGRSGTAGAP